MMPDSIAIEEERIDRFSQRPENTTPEAIQMCPIAQERNVPRARPFPVAYVAGERSPATDHSRPRLEKSEDAGAGTATVPSQKCPACPPSTSSLIVVYCRLSRLCS